MATNVQEYLIQLVLATRKPAPYSETLAKWVQYGGSPRATIALDRCARAHAWLSGRAFVTPEDVQNMIFDVMRHRVLLTYEAEADGVTVDDYVRQLVAIVPVP